MPNHGGSADVFKIIEAAPGLEDFWQLHFSVSAGKDHNSADSYIANVDEECQGLWLRVTAQKDGTFTVYNPRNKFERTYKQR